MPEPIYCTYPLADLVADICLKAGLTEDMFDVTGLTGNVLGFQITSAQPAFAHLQSLSKMFFFAPSNYDGKLYFHHFGTPAVMDVDPDDVIEGSLDQVKKRDGVLPRVIHLNYYDLMGQLEVDIQSSERSLFLRENAELSLDTPVIMQAPEAAQKATIIHKTAVEEQRGQLKISLPEKYLALTVGDVFTLSNHRFRVLEVNVDAGFQEYTAVYDRKSSWSSTATGFALPPPPAPYDYTPSATDMVFLDLEIFRTADDQLGYYMAVSGSNDAWSGATLELSTDGGENYADSTYTMHSAVMGAITTGSLVEVDDPYVPDELSTIQVTISTPYVELTPASLAELMGRANLAVVGNDTDGWEIVNFGNAVEISDGVWELDYFLRGRRHTPVQAHAIGDRFILLERTLPFFVPAETYLLDDELTFRATTFDSDEQTIVTGTLTGRSQLEPPPSYLRARREGGNLVIDWIGTGVTGAKTSVDMSANFTHYRVDVNGSVSTTTDETLTVADPGGAVTIQVQQVNSITGPGKTAEITL